MLLENWTAENWSESGRLLVGIRERSELVEERPKRIWSVEVQQLWRREGRKMMIRQRICKREREK